jgi:hypothetical protein
MDIWKAQHYLFWSWVLRLITLYIYGYMNGSTILAVINFKSEFKSSTTIKGASIEQWNAFHSK